MFLKVQYYFYKHVLGLRKKNQKRHEMLRAQPFLTYSARPELRIFLIGTDPYREPRQLESCPRYKRLKGIHDVGKYSYFLSCVVSSRWSQHEETL